MLGAANQVIARCHELAQCTEEPGYVTRTFLSAPMHEVHAKAGTWMRQAGMTVTVDAAGNLRGHYAGVDKDAPPLVIGSHLDTVPRAGSFDGILGVMFAISLVENLNGARLRPAIEVIGFSEEEGVRYGVPFIGSRAVMGTVDSDLLSKISPAIREFGLDPSAMPDAALNNISGYLEIHIEQGPVLESVGEPIGLVEAIAGQTRLVLLFEGKANHAGTTPMNLRHDALAAAAAWIGVVEQEAQGVVGLVATVGRIDAQPNASNVIAGSVSATLDVRHANDTMRSSAVSRMLHAAQEAAAKRGVTANWEIRMDQPAVAMDTRLTELLAHAVTSAGFHDHRMVSGAGHDAMIIGRRFPAAMLFVRSPGGISHHPHETVLMEDVAAALATGMNFLKQWEARDE